MHRIMPKWRSVLIGAVAAAGFGITLAGQSVLGPPREANHFVETPAGWVHPMMAWGEGDLEATLNMMQAAGIPLERPTLPMPSPAGGRARLAFPPSITASFWSSRSTRTARFRDSWSAPT